MDKLEIRKALEDVTLLRRILDTHEATASDTANKLKIGKYLFASIIGFAILFYEYYNSQPNRDAFLYSKYDSTFLINGISTVATMLFVLCTTLIGLVFLGAKYDKSKFVDFVSINFSYLRGIGFFADLFVKFTLLALILLAGKGEWTGILFLIFLSDYLLQGRFFKISYKSELALGLMLIILAAVQFYNDNSSLLPSFASFFILSILSLLNSLKDRKII